MGPEDKSRSRSWQARFIDNGGHAHGAHERPHCALAIRASDHSEAPSRGAGAGSRAIRLLQNLSLLLTSAKASNYAMGPTCGVAEKGNLFPEVNRSCLGGFKDKL